MLAAPVKSIRLERESGEGERGGRARERERKGAREKKRGGRERERKREGRGRGERDRERQRQRERQRERHRARERERTNERRPTKWLFIQFPKHLTSKPASDKLYKNNTQITTHNAQFETIEQDTNNKTWFNLGQLQKQLPHYPSFSFFYDNRINLNM